MSGKHPTLTVNTLPGVIATGATISYGVGNIPVCILDLAPGQSGHVAKVSQTPGGILTALDSFKRKQLIDVDIMVPTHIGTSKSKEPNIATLKFKGWLDGVSLNHSVGGTGYQAVLKGRHQTLLEVTKLMPGLYPTSINVYKSPFYSAQTKSGSGEDHAATTFVALMDGEDLDFQENPIKFYTSLMKVVLKKQKGELGTYLGTEERYDGTRALQKIMQDKRYTKAIDEALQLMETIDLGAVSGGFQSHVVSAQMGVQDTLKHFFFQGPQPIFENYLNFLNYMGCTLVCSKDKAFVVPMNSCLKQQHVKPALRQLQTQINQANPADYNSYVYNDNGYRDIASVVLTGSQFNGGAGGGSQAAENCFVGVYVDNNELSKASGTLVIDGHAFMSCQVEGYAWPDYNNEGKTQLDGKQTLMPLEQLFEDVYSDTVLEDAMAKKDAYMAKSTPDLYDNYAEQKYFQARYGDRNGSLTMDFNPKWVPGCGGTLYIRATDMFLDFYVHTVTHKLSMEAPNSGTAITMISFNCGRMGNSPIGVSSDEFLGYDQGKEKAFQSAFVADTI